MQKGYSTIIKITLLYKYDSITSGANHVSVAHLILIIIKNVIIHVDAPANQPIFMLFVIICSDDATQLQTAWALL